ncbi:Serine racemase [Oopsacas minuta]|uniref:Serine racemase n=1 Tax=Oopsacas minuta TaxID=111878 RepID=A0AAV7KF99_9METZ|nr:Serine racemase [Oopsacas minuta]
MASEEPSLPEMNRIRQAHKVLKEYIHYTPVMTSSSLDKFSGINLHFKCENFQKTGSFKIRGCMFAVDNFCKEKTIPPILVTHSSGNHGVALSKCAKIRGLQAHVIMPDTNKYKQSAVKANGAEIHLCGDSEQARVDMTNQIMKELGPAAVFISPHSDPDVIAGQGTVGIEILEQVPHVDAIVVAVSGGGLAAGICIAAKSIKPSIHIYAAEPESANDCAQSFAAKKRITLKTSPVTIADGLRQSVGTLTWPVLQEHLTDVITVTEEEIISAMYLSWERLKIIVEPSAAAAIAASFKLKHPSSSTGVQNVCVVVCGGNVDLASIPPKP